MTRELCLQAENTLHTGDGEWREGRGIFWLTSIRYMGHSDKWGETTRYTERKLQKTVIWNINKMYLLTSYYNQLLSSGIYCIVCAWLIAIGCRGTCTWPAHRHRNTLVYALLKLFFYPGARTTPLKPLVDTESNILYVCTIPETRQKCLWVEIQSLQSFFFVFKTHIMSQL